MPEETLPPDTELVKHIKIRSRLLSDFHGRPIDLRAGVILPRDFARQPDRRYPVRVHIGGYGGRYTNVDGMMAAGSGFRRAWMADDAPPMILIHLDGAGPLGDPYQVDSANHGPYGAAVTGELIPHVERLSAASAGARPACSTAARPAAGSRWPCRSSTPTSSTAPGRSAPTASISAGFSSSNIYEDENAYINRHGFERPAARDVSGEVRFTMRHECRLENVLGRGDSWTLSGGQWGAWNATYGPAAPTAAPSRSGTPRPARSTTRPPSTGRRTTSAASSRSAGPSWARSSRGSSTSGSARPTTTSSTTPCTGSTRSCPAPSPPYEGSITYGPGQGHCWMGISQREMMKQMARRMAAATKTAKPMPPSGD